MLRVLHRHNVRIQGNGAHRHNVRIQNANATHGHPHDITVDSNIAEHTHVVQQNGGDLAHENRPPYYALCYIIQAA